MRLDLLLVERGLAPSREKAQALIMAGQVLVNQQKADKPGRAVPGDCAIELLGQTKYVSRGGMKLEAALRHFDIQPGGRVCLDVGTSTGGFVDCLLQHGAARVHAVDVGASQMHWTLRQDPRVILHEHTNARHLAPAALGEKATLAVCDVSFISVTLIVAPLAACVESGGEMVILIKPQFEVGREAVGKGGIVRDEDARRRACEKVSAAVGALGFTLDLIPCPVLGAEGNQEYLLHARCARSKS
jgi:23S rRNA (cytidine1920-2'-O)/16S rRNA (cytidine1409-2'-O)-methyltransferase